MGKWGERSAPTCSYLSYVSSTSFKLFQYFPESRLNSFYPPLLCILLLVRWPRNSTYSDQQWVDVLQDRAALFGKVQQSQRAHTITGNRIGRRHKNYKISSVEPQPLSHRRNLLTSYCFDLNKLILKREQIDNSIAIYRWRYHLLYIGLISGNLKRFLKSNRNNWEMVIRFC